MPIWDPINHDGVDNDKYTSSSSFNRYQEGQLALNIDQEGIKN